ncbi:MAG: sigma-70 family RNA polymerase sigma factor [Planctomycetes bacterium]|nr:sigma-70 family RNA polymerase sigma factor [Planctomycetota bacterium]
MDTGSHGAVPLEALLAESAWLRRLATSLVRDPAAAEDLVQETWLAALKNPPAADRPLRPWLRTVLENFVRMRARSEQSRTARERREARDEVTQGEVELVDRVEEQRFLAREVLKLEEPFRSTLVLRYYEGLSSIQIAERVGSNDNTVRWRLKRGLELLRERLDRRHGGDRAAWLALLAPLAPQELAPVAARPASSGVTAWLAGAAAMLAVVVGVWFAVREPEQEPQLAAVASVSAPAAATATDPGRTAVERSEAASAPTRTTLAPARIRARVLDARSEPVSGAQALLEFGDGKGPSALVRADGALDFELPGDSVLASSDVLELSASGFEPLRVYAPVRLGETLELGDLVMRRTGLILGSVRDARGAPLEAAEVRLERLGERFGALREPPLTEILLTGAGLETAAPVRVESERDGRFRLDGVAEGYYRVWIRAEGFARQCSAPVGVLQSETVTLEPFVLAPPAPERLVRGVVVDAQGSPVANARVVGQRATLSREFHWSEGDVRTTSDAQGRFTLVAEPGKGYMIAATDGPRFAVAYEVVGDPGERTLQLRDWPTLELAVRAMPIGELEIEGVKDPADGPPFTWQIAEGVIGVRVERTREFTLRVVRGPFVYQRREPARDADALAQPVRIDVGAPVVRELEVRVLAQGEPLEGARVEPRVTGEWPGWISPTPGATTDRTGVAKVVWCGDAITSVWVRAAGWAPYVVREHPAGDRLEVELVRGGVVAGTVRDHLGRGVRGARVSMDSNTDSVLTDLNGAYRIDGVGPGRWSVNVSARMPSNVPRKTQSAARSDVDLRGEVTVLAEHVTQLDFELPEPPPCVLRGRVVLDGSADGPRIVELSAPGDSRVLFRARTDPRGDFEFALHHPGAYELRCDSLAEGGSRSEVRQRVTLVRGATEFRLELPSALLSVVLDAAPAPAHELVAVVNTPPDGEWTAYARFDAEGRARVRIPAGRCRFAVEGVDQPELELDLRAGETREIRWPPR